MDAFLFGVLPYLALTALVIGAVRRFRVMRFTVTTSSSSSSRAGSSSGARSPGTTRSSASCWPTSSPSSSRAW